MATKKKIEEPLKLSLACGNNKPEGFKGVDAVKTPAADYVGDLLVFPKKGKKSVWDNFKDNSVDEIECSMFVEHIPHGTPPNDPFFEFFDQAYRILKPAEFDPANPNIPTKGFMKIVCPYYNSMRCWQDPTHHRAISEASFLYLNKKWRDDNKLDHYPISCDFDFYYNYNIAPEWAQRNQEALQYAMKHYTNVISDIIVTIVKRPAEKSKK